MRNRGTTVLLRIHFGLGRFGQSKVVRGMDEQHAFLQQHSREFLEMVYRADRIGSLAQPDGYAKRTGECGDTVEMFLSVRGNQVQMLTFQVAGCMNTVACANTVSHMVEGRMVSDCWHLSAETVIEYLKTLPADHHHCAELAVGALYHALSDYSRKCGGDAWKKAYPVR
jgi:nitrogen fixation protein NifU and related proteins